MSVTGGILYKDFVKENYEKVRHLSPKQRLSEIAKLWREKTGKSKMAKGKKADAEGAGIFSDILGGIGLGMPAKKRGRKPKGKGIVGGDAEGAGIFSGLLGSIGLGMPEAVKAKHYKKMCSLEKKMHSKGKLSPKEHHKLKVYHTLHGQGFFDSLWSGIRKGVGAVTSIVPKAINTIGSIAQVVPEIAKVVPGVGNLAAPIMGLASKVAPLAPLAAML